MNEKYSQTIQQHKGKDKSKFALYVGETEIYTATSAGTVMYLASEQNYVLLFRLHSSILSTGTCI